MRKQRWKLSLVIIFAVIMMASSVADVRAKVTSSKKALPDFIEASIAMMYPNASDSKLDEIRALWAKQIELKQEMIEATNGAVLNFDPSTLQGSGAYMSYLTKVEAWGGGQMINPNNMVGLIDYSFARFYTPGLGQGVGVAGRLSSDYASGQVYVYAKLGPTGAGKTGNYLITWGSNTGADWSWVPIGYAQIVYPYNWPYAAYHYTGYTSQTYKYVAVTANTVMGDLCVYNDVLGDMVWFTSG